MSHQHKTPSVARRLVCALALGAAFLVVDQVSKGFILEMLHHRTLPVTVIPGLIDFDFVANTGVSFGLARGFGEAFVVLAAIIVVAIAVYLVRARRVSWFEVVGLGMLAGGAIGNAIDRATLGFVVDFIATTFISFPVFNVADIGITVGVAIAFVGFLLFGPKEDEDADQADSVGNMPAASSAACSAPAPVSDDAGPSAAKQDLSAARDA